MASTLGETAAGSGSSRLAGMRRLLALLLLSVPLLAQTPFRKHYITVGGGGGVPGGEIGSGLVTSPVFRLGYGYRFHPYFQADLGFDTVFHAAKVRDFVSTQFGDLRLKDYQYMLPMGGRAIIPLRDNRILLHAGGGGAYLRYQERIRQPFGGSNFRLDCPSCRERSGWGYYGLVGVSVALDRSQNFRFGFSSRVFRANTSGDAFGPLPAFTTRDQWVNTAAEFTISF
jgi:hypothetical protein